MGLFFCSNAGLMPIEFSYWYFYRQGSNFDVAQLKSGQSMPGIPSSQRAVVVLLVVTVNSDSSSFYSFKVKRYGEMA